MDGREEVPEFWFSLEVEETMRKIYRVRATSEEEGLAMIGEPLAGMRFIREVSPVPGSYTVRLVKTHRVEELWSEAQEEQQRARPVEETWKGGNDGGERDPAG